MLKILARGKVQLPPHWHNFPPSGHTPCNRDAAFNYSRYLSFAQSLRGCFLLLWWLKMSKEFVEKGTALRPFELTLLIQVWCIYIFFFPHDRDFYTCSVCIKICIICLLWKPFWQHHWSSLNYFSLGFRLYLYKMWWNPVLENKQDWQPWKLKSLLIHVLASTA